MDSKQQPKKNGSSVVKKAVKNINKLVTEGDSNLGNAISARFNRVKSKAGAQRINKEGGKVYPDRGVVYLGHIPHGFYEEEMKGFFSQFGHVSRIRLVRSHKTGNSKGYAFIEFRFSEVAQVVAETMNNYLMGNRLLKAVYIPPEKQTVNMMSNSKNFGPDTCIGAKNRREAISQQNKLLTEEELKSRIDRNKLHLLELQEKLKAQGVDCLFQVNNGTSKRLIEETNAAPSSKRVRTSSPTPKAKTSKLSEVSPAPTLKKKSNSSKVQVSQKSVKSIKNVKSAEKSSKKLSGVVAKVGVEKNSVKKPVKLAKKVVKKPTVSKVVSTKKEVAKKSVMKKQVAKKK